MNPEYSVQIIWSKEDEAYLAAPFELPGCVADGQTPEEALRNLRQVIEEWISVANEEGRQIPPPMTVADHERLAAQFQKDLQRHIRQQVQNAVEEVLKQITEQQQHTFWASGAVVRGVEVAESAFRS
jgi:predicted RNase H-like HicB family nuclease